MSRWRGVWLAVMVSLPGPAESEPVATDAPAPAEGPPQRDAPRSGEPCKLEQFFQNLASTNARRAPAIDVALAEQALWANVGFTRGRRRVTVSRAQILKELEQGRGSRLQTLVRLGHSLARAWADPEGDGMLLLPAEAGGVLHVGQDYQVRIYGERCEGHVTEIRDTQGSWLRPLPLEPDQPGFDCREDGRVFDTEPPRSLIQKALKARAPDYEGTRLVHTIFPRSSTPMIREVQEHAGGECSQVYFGVFSDPDTCDGRKVSFTEELGKLHCCSAAACAHSVEYYFYSLVDALSFQRASAIKGYIRPGRSLKLTGYPFEHDRLLTRSTPDSEIIGALAKGPGWVGTDHAGCSDTTPVEIDYGDARPETAACEFGGGGRSFTIGFWRAGPGKRWYATELRGDAH